MKKCRSEYLTHSYRWDRMFGVPEGESVGLIKVWNRLQDWY
jgi:hypothetical protein